MLGVKYAFYAFPLRVITPFLRYYAFYRGVITPFTEEL